MRLQVCAGRRASDEGRLEMIRVIISAPNAQVF